MIAAAEVALVLAALGSMMLAGSGVLALLIGASARLSRWEFVALSWLLGTGTTSLLLWIGGFFLRGATLQAVMTIACVALACVGWRSWRNAAVPRMASHKMTIVDWAVGAVIFGEILVVFIAAARHDLGWDGILNWEIKARYIFLNGGALPDQYFQSASRAFSHPEYPLFIPLTEAWLYLWLGAPSQFWAMSIFPIFYAAGMILLATTCRRITDRIWIGGVATTIVFLLPYVLTGIGNAVSGYADFPIGVLYLATIVFLLRFSLDRDRSSFRIFVALLTLLPWMKREGVVLYVVALLLGAFVLWHQRASWRNCIALTPGFAIASAWHFFLETKAVLAPRDFVPVTLSALTANLGRGSVILEMTAREMIRLTHWNIFWPALALALAWRVWRARNRESIIIIAAIVLPIAIYASTYLFSSWDQVQRHITSSVARLLLHVVPLGALAIALAFFPESREESCRKSN